jgi:hypothetical protein
MLPAESRDGEDLQGTGLSGGEMQKGPEPNVSCGAIEEEEGEDMIFLC